MTNNVKIQLGILGLAFVLGLFFYFGFLLFPVDTKYRQTILQLKQSHDKLNAIKARINDLPKIQYETKILQQEVDVLQKYLPQEKEIPGLLRTLTLKAQKYGLQINSITPLKIEPREHYSEIPFQLSLRGKYHLIGHFLTDIAQQMRLLSSRDLNLFYSAAGQEKNDLLNINSDFVLLAFIYTQ